MLFRLLASRLMLEGMGSWAEPEVGVSVSGGVAWRRRVRERRGKYSGGLRLFQKPDSGT